MDNTSVPIPEPPPELMTMIRVIGQDRHLRSWLKRLVELPANLRASEIGQLTATMTANGEDAKLTHYPAVGRLEPRGSFRYTEMLPPELPSLRP